MMCEWITWMDGIGMMKNKMFHHLITIMTLPPTILSPRLSFSQKWSNESNTKFSEEINVTILCVSNFFVTFS